MAKKLILFSDGTWNRPEQKDRDRLSPSNVVKMARAIDQYDDAGNEQWKFYDRGVGVEGGFFNKIFGGLTGFGISENIKDLYSFLVENFEPGDLIYCFGYSRGAYTVRSLCGLINKCGLLRRENLQKIDQAYGLYRKRWLSSDHPAIVSFKSEYCIEIKIHFLGVWDTVGALGFPTPFLRLITRPYYRFHNEQLSPIVQNAFQALAIDEQRKHFAPSLWKKDGVKSYQTVEQVWFAGVHTNIGGGYVDTGLSDISFLWMKSRAEKFGLKFNRHYIERTINPEPFGELRNSRKSFYLLFRKFLRPIYNNKNANEFIHMSVFERLNEITISYSPVNLLKVIDEGIVSFTD